LAVRSRNFVLIKQKILALRQLAFSLVSSYFTFKLKLALRVLKATFKRDKDL